MSYESAVTHIGRAVEAVGVAAIILGGVIATVRFFRRLRQTGSEGDAYRLYRRDLGRALLLGLEFLVAGDIIRTTAAPTFYEVGVLAVIVLIRTFLGVALQVETEGRWPWRGHGDAGTGTQSSER